MKRRPVLKGPGFLSFAEYRDAVMNFLDGRAQGWLSITSADLSRLLIDTGVKTFGARKFDATSARDFRRSALSVREKQSAGKEAERQRRIAERTEPWKRELARLRSYKPGVLTSETRRKLAERDDRVAVLLRWIEEEEQQTRSS